MMSNARELNDTKGWTVMCLMWEKTKTTQIAKVHIIQYTHRFRFIDMVKCEMYSTK